MYGVKIRGGQEEGTGAWGKDLRTTGKGRGCIGLGRA